jgi:hypothetical protein
VLLRTPQGPVRYQVTSLRVVPSTDVSVLEPTHDAMLTLVTCYPFWVLGHAPDRFIVRATRVAESTPDVKPVPVSWPREQAPAPVAERPARPKSLGTGDNEALVRQAIERFRMTYNARFTSHGEERAGGPLIFQSCRVTLDVDSATATCQSAAAPSERLDVLERTFSLRKVGGVWAIKSFSILP